MVKEKAFAQSLLDQTDAVLDAIEGTKTVDEVLHFVGDKFVDKEKVRKRIEKLREATNANVGKKPNANKKSGKK